MNMKMKEREHMSMYQDEYKKWLEADLVDFDLKKELQDIEGDDAAIKERLRLR